MHTPIKVTELELSEPIKTIEELDGYIGIKVILQLFGTPIADMQLPIVNGVCPENLIKKTILEKYTGCIISELVRQRLNSPVDNSAFDTNEILQSHSYPLSKKPLLTVAVCTRDRTEDLAICLDSLIKLNYDNLDLLVVDNAPGDDQTKELVDNNYPTVRYSCEPRPGLNWARNRAILEAKGEIIAYADDDVVVDENWARSIVTVFEDSPDVMGMTGLVVSHEFETKAQLMFEYYGGFSRGYQRKWIRIGDGSQPGWGYLGTGQYGTGANMAFRRNVFADIGLFDPALDVGTVTNGGGDLEMIFRVLKEQHTLVYEPAAMVRHRHRKDYQKLLSQITNNGVGFLSYLTRVFKEYPDERKHIFRVAHWWFDKWAARRIIRSFLSPQRIPRELMINELKGSFTGLRRYKKAVANAKEIERKFGPAEALDIQASNNKCTVYKENDAIAVRTIDISQPIETLSDVHDYATVRFFVMCGEHTIGTFDVHNKFQNISRMHLRDLITNHFGTRLLNPDRSMQDGELWNKLTGIISDNLLAASEKSTEKPIQYPVENAVSIVVATFDRPHDLRICLSSLLAQKTSRKVEIIVIDNNADSGLTAPILKDFPEVIHVKEERKGSSYARNAGILNSTGEIIVSIDDDVTAPPDWLEKLLAPFSRADVMAVTGNVLPLTLDNKSQVMFEQYGGLGRGYESFEVNGDWFHSFEKHPVPTWKLGGTANAAFRSSVFQHPEIGLMEESLGPGTPTGVGEDTLLFYNILRQGYTMYYAPDAYVWHKHRDTMKALRKQIYCYSKGHVAYHLFTAKRHGDLRGLAQVFIHLPIWRLKQLYWQIKGRIFRWDSNYPFSLLMLEIAGNLAGPWTLLVSKRRVDRLGKSLPNDKTAEVQTEKLA